MTTAFTCTHCDYPTGFIHTASGMICESCKNQAVPVQNVQTFLWRPAGEQITELERMFRL